MFLLGSFRYCLCTAILGFLNQLQYTNILEVYAYYILLVQLYNILLMHVFFIPQNLPANFSADGFGQTLNELNFPEIKIKCFPLLERCQENDNY